MHRKWQSRERRTGADGEQQPLLSDCRSFSPSKTKMQRLREHMMDDVCNRWADLVLLFCYVITGLLDSASILIWGSFVSMQTGNTVYFGLGLTAPHESTRWIKAAVSLAFFSLGSFVFSRFHASFSPKRRWVLIASFSAQFAMVGLAAAIVTVGPAPENIDAVTWNVLVPVALVAFQSCGQAVTSRALKVNTLTSVVLTTLICDLFSDMDLFALHNRERNRRAGAPVFMLLGAVAGGFFARSSIGIAGALWAAAVCKLAIVVAWIFWPTADFWEDEEEDE